MTPYQFHLNTHLSDPDLLATICAHVANGGTLITLCETWELRFSDIMAWIHADIEGREKAYIKALNDRAEWGQEVVLAELRAIGTADRTKIFNGAGKLLPVSEWPKDVAKAVAGYEESDTQWGVSIKVKYTDKLKALELLGKQMGMFVEKRELSGTVTLEQLVSQSREG